MTPLRCGQGCGCSRDCFRTKKDAQFAIDNIVTFDAVTVLEPASFALFGLGLAGLIAVRRRA